jgi:V/A-type H+-transporting ATPase subunit C
MKLDFYYYNNLWKAKKRNLTGSNNKVATLLNGTEIDMQNIAWIYRLKTYYNLPNTLIYQYIIPIKYRIDNESMTRLIEAQTQAQLFNEIKSTTYGYAFTENKGIEKVYYDIMAKVHRRALSDGGDSIAVIMEYLFRKHLETDNIISLVEGVRYHLNPDEIIMFLYLNDADQGGD